MTIMEAINGANRLFPNNEYTQTEKIAWLNRIDTQIKQEIIDIRQDADSVAFHGYDEDTDENTSLLVPVPYDEVYIFYLKSQMELYNGDINRYSATAAALNDRLTAFRNAYNRQHAAKNVPLKF